MSGFMQKRLFGIFAKREMNYFTTILFRGMREIGHISRFAVPGKVTELREQIPGEFSQRAWWLSIDLYHSWTVSGICSTPAREVKAAFQSCFSLTMPNTNLSPQMWIFLTGESFKKGMKKTQFAHLLISLMWSLLMTTLSPMSLLRLGGGAECVSPEHAWKWDIVMQAIVCWQRSCLSHKVQGREGNQHLRLSSDLYACTLRGKCTCRHAHTCVHTYTHARTHTNFSHTPKDSSVLNSRD